MIRTLTALSIAALVLLVGCGSATDTSAEPAGDTETELQKAYDACLPLGSGVYLTDEGHTLLVGGVKEDDDITDVACVLVGIKTPESVIAALDSTTAMMGRQDRTAGDYRYEWSYHPDNGLDLIITDDAG